jgi:prophage regulatory protein
MAHLAELHRGATIIHQRIQQDTISLGEVHRNISLVLAELCALAEPQTPAPELPVLPSPRVLRLADVSQRVGLCRSSIWRLVKEGIFPSPRRLSQRAVGWVAEEVDQWLKTRERG